MPTEYDEATNTLKANIKEQGTYFIMDLTTLYTGLGILDVQKITPKMYAAARQLSMPQMVQEDIVSGNTNKIIDLVFVIDTNYTIESYMPIIKESLSGIMHTLSGTEKIDLNISVVDYQYRNPNKISVRINNLSSAAIKERNLDPFNKDIDAVSGIMDKFALSMPGSWDLNSVPIGAFGYVEEFPFRQNSNRFALLITDKSYRIDNDHGYNDVYELFDKLNAKDISVSVATLHTLDAYDKWAENCNGIKINMFKKVNFAEEYTNFVLNNISQGTDFKIIASNTLKEINLAAPLKLMGQTDTDEDGLTDSDEVEWKYIELKEDGSFNLPMLGGLWVQTYPFYDAEAFENLPFLTELKELRVLPLKSDPTLIDSDDDGLEDKDDEYPFINTIKGLWYKVRIGNKDIYIGQQKYGEQYLRAKLCDKGSTEGETYKFTGTDWIPVDEEIDLSNITTDVTLGEDRLNLNNIEKDIVIDFSKIVDISKQPYVNSYLHQYENQEMVLYGKIMGFADSLFPPKDIIIAILNEVGAYDASFFVHVYFPSNEKVKSGILFFINKCNLDGEELTLEELEQNEVYLVSKMATEFVMFVAAMETGAKLYLAGKALFDAGALKLIAGTVGIVMPDGTILKVVSVKGVVIGVVQVAAGVVVAGAGIGIAASVGRNAGSSAWDDYGKLKAINYAKVEQEIAKVAKKYENLECVECAKELKKIIQKNKMKGRQIKLTYKNNGRGFIWSDTANRAISENSFHTAIEFNGKVYDNIHPNGIEYEKWLADFYAIGEMCIEFIDF